MKLKHAFLLCSLASSLLLSSCITKFTAAERARLSTVAVSQTKEGPEAYEEPYGGDVDARNAATQAAGGGLIALAVTHSIAGAQNNRFVGESGHHFTAVKKNTPGNLPSRFQTKLQESMKSDAFFKSRIRPAAPNNFTSEITCYRLARVGENAQGKLTFVAEVYVDIHLKDQTGKNLAGGSLMGRSTESHTINEYASDSVKVRKAYDSAQDSAINQFKAGLAIKTGE